MRVRLLFFARVRQQIGLSEAEFDVPEATSVRELVRLTEERFSIDLSKTMLAVNEEYTELERVLLPDDELAFIPPVAGGALLDDEDVFMLSVSALDLAELHACLVRPRWGGQAMFTGSTRSPNLGVEIEQLEYEAFGSMCVRVMQDLACEARDRWELGRVLIAHRIGVVKPAELSFVVGCASAHRQPCLEAVPWLVDEAKSRLPIWKLERTASGEHWVEGTVRYPTL